MQYVEQSKFVLFSDADIQWERDALARMVDTLTRARARDQAEHNAWLTGYSYGGYYLQEPTMFTDGRYKTFRGPIGNEPWSCETLVQRNFVSSMSLIYRDALEYIGSPVWDESLLRLQDWDIWLRMAQEGWKGEWVGGVTFTTPIRKGITFATDKRNEHTNIEHGISYEEAAAIVRSKHGLR